jgi:hypothetical protein
VYPRPKPLHREKHPDLDVEGCLGCKLTQISIASIPGGTRPGSAKAAQERQFKRDMDAYWRARRAGESPEGTTEAAVRATRQRQEAHEKTKQRIIDQGGELYV